MIYGITALKAKCGNKYDLKYTAQLLCRIFLEGFVLRNPLLYRTCCHSFDKILTHK